MVYMIAQITGDNLHVANQTTLHPVGVSVLVVALIAAFLLPRRYAMLPLMALIAIIPSAQRVVMLTLDFTLVRVLVLGMLLRITARNEWMGFRPRAADYLLLAWAAWAILAYGILWGDPAAVMSRTGYMIDAVGAWLVARVLLRDFADLERLTRFCALMAIVSVSFFIMEWMTGRNIFSVFGGVPSVTMIRDGRLRCQGPFSHPIMAGIFWASLLPIFWAVLVSDAKSRVLMTLGIGAALVIVVTTASSTPVMAVLLSGLAMALYPARPLMPAIRWGTLGVLIFLNFVMEKGVHHLLARINVVGGSTGWHRYHLMDEAIRHLAEWAAIGTRSTRHWGWGLEDVTNQYVLEGVRGGLVSLVFFVTWLIVMFTVLSRAIRRESSPSHRLILWSCGSILFAHCLNFIAVSFFGQMVTAFYILSAVSTSLAAAPTARRNTRRHAASSESWRPSGSCDARQSNASPVISASMHMSDHDTTQMMGTSEL